MSELEKIIEIYTNYCKILNREQNIKVISAVELNEEEKEKVVASVKKQKPDVRFKVSYEVDATILGGLQIYAGS